MARRRTRAPRTPFGAWLEQWLADHPDVTHEAFAADVGVSKGLISQWTAGTVKQIGSINLQAVSARTGTDLALLERLVYGATSRPAPTLDPAIAAEIHAAVGQGIDRLGLRLEELLRELLAGGAR